jgi:hypothetical protein
MKLKSMASLLALSFAVLTAVPTPAAQAAHPTCHLGRHRAAACRVARRQTVFGTAIERRPTAQYQPPPAAPKNDWPADMILDSFQSHELSSAGKMPAPYAI